MSTAQDLEQVVVTLVRIASSRSVRLRVRPGRSFKFSACSGHGSDGMRR
jgi:hypothetical protein